MLTAVRFFNRRGDTIELPLDSVAGGSQYVIKNIDGLGPPKADILITSYVGMDGGVYQTAKGNVRNLVFQLGFNPSYTSEDPFGELRRALYPYLTPKMQVEMQFLSSNFETVTVIGYVESFEPSIFTPKPEVQISILCPDPFFYSLVPITVSRVGQGVLNVTNPGTVDTGFIFTLDGIAASSGNFALRRTEPFEDRMDYVGEEYTRDSGGGRVTVQVVTIKGSKSAGWVLHADYDPNIPFDGANLLGYIDGWLDVIPGDNVFLITFLDEINTVTTTMSFTPRYVGL